ncbi:hypothetical protein LCGC14_1572080 [marine sediment metagenome]|uniref:Uncharacterized protein n=1 Tax=marine sediment metagenome TaxID=412755 RepID=A0A0F9J5M5_9ZZZZ
MATRIEIIAISDRSVSAAFYFPIAVNDRIAGANDPARTAAGNLSGQELVDLQFGALHEIVGTHPTGNATRAQIATKLAARWGSVEGTALAHYIKTHDRAQDIGKVWNGTDWS